MCSCSIIQYFSRGVKSFVINFSPRLHYSTYIYICKYVERRILGTQSAVRFSETSKETLEDKILRLIEREVSGNA
ncbi:MAG: transposon-encoded TnpW family protein [Clostridiales Family XIII bacterium]|nr:transposon-encoded TnpW family protein [Clostridiales Family XIII bacterium]